MKYDDLNFTISSGATNLKYDVIAVVPNDDCLKEPYIVFTDYILDDNDDFILYYGKLINYNGATIIKKITNSKEKSYIKERMKNDEDVIKVNRSVRDSMI